MIHMICNRGGGALMMPRCCYSFLSLLVCLSSASCGLPEPINVRQQFSKGIEPLGVAPFYPLVEEARLGQVYLVDESTIEAGGDPAAYVPTSTNATNAAVPFMEKFRAANMAPGNRFPCSSDKLGSQIVLANQTPSFYEQPDCASAAASSDGAAKSSSSAQQGNEITININNAAPQPAKTASAA